MSSDVKHKAKTKSVGKGKEVDASSSSNTRGNRPKLLSVYCRFVPTDQWFSSHIDPTWSVKQTKKWLLSRCIPSFVTVPPSFRPPSPVTFATRSRPSSDDEYEEYDEAEDSDLDSLNGSLYQAVDAFHNENIGRRRRKNTNSPPTGTLSSDFKSGNAKEVDYLRAYAIYSYSDGYRLDDSGDMRWYKIAPHSLLEIQRVDAYVPFERDDRYILPYYNERIMVWEPAGVGSVVGGAVASPVVGGEGPTPLGGSSGGAQMHPKPKKEDTRRPSKGEWKSRTVVIAHGHLSILRSLKDSEVLKRVSVDHLSELGEGGGRSRCTVLEGTKVVFARFGDWEFVFSFGTEEKETTALSHLLRVLHRSHPDPSTSLKTSFIHPLTRMPIFAKPPKSESSDSLSSLSDNFSSPDIPTTPAASLTNLRLGAPVQYPEWRTRVFERAREAGLGYRFPKPVRIDVYRHFKSMTKGELDGVDGEVPQVRDDTSTDTTTTMTVDTNADTDMLIEFEFESEDEQEETEATLSEIEWDNWANDIERQRPRSVVESASDRETNAPFEDEEKLDPEVYGYARGGTWGDQWDEDDNYGQVESEMAGYEGVGVGASGHSPRLSPIKIKAARARSISQSSTPATSPLSSPVSVVHPMPSVSGASSPRSSNPSPSWRARSKTITGTSPAMPGGSPYPTRIMNEPLHSPPMSPIFGKQGQGQFTTVPLQLSSQIQRGKQKQLSSPSPSPHGLPPPKHVPHRHKSATQLADKGRRIEPSFPGPISYASAVAGSSSTSLKTENPPLSPILSRTEKKSNAKDNKDKGKLSRGSSIRTGASSMMKRGKETLVKQLDHALDFVEGK